MKLCNCREVQQPLPSSIIITISHRYDRTCAHTGIPPADICRFPHTGLQTRRYWRPHYTTVYHCRQGSAKEADMECNIYTTLSSTLFIVWRLPLKKKKHKKFYFLSVNCANLRPIFMYSTIRYSITLRYSIVYAIYTYIYRTLCDLKSLSYCRGRGVNWGPNFLSLMALTCLLHSSLQLNWQSPGSNIMERGGGRKYSYSNQTHQNIFLLPTACLAWPPNSFHMSLQRPTRPPRT